MQSVIKRNRNSISRVQNKLSSVFKTMGISNSETSFIRSRIEVPKSISHKTRTWDTMYITFRLGIANPKFMTIETDGKLLIGLSLSDSSITVGYSTKDVVYALNSALDEPSSAYASDISKILHKELGITVDNWKGKWNHEYDNLYPQTTTYKEIVKWANKIQSDSSIVLKSGEYPFSPRDFLPIFVLDSESLEGWFISDSSTYDLNYRKNHLPTSLNYLSSNVVVALRNIPLKLCEIRAGGSTYSID